MKKVAKKTMVYTIIATIVFGAWATARTVKYMQFDINCTQYIKRAADANTVDRAKEELGKAISYAEKNNLTEGVVSLFLEQPENDIGYWYQNMTDAYDELENLPEDATAMEKTNVLMKLRETLTDETESGVSVTVPEGISIYPDNVVYVLCGILSGLAFVYLWMDVIITKLYRD